MNINKFTQKSIEAVNQCEKIANDYGNQEIDQEHFLYSLLTIEDSLIASLIEKMGIDKDTFIKNIETLLSQKNKVSGNVQLFVSNDLKKLLYALVRCCNHRKHKMLNRNICIPHSLCFIFCIY